jgi:uncharacterized alpha-E superfamily protein
MTLQDAIKVVDELSPDELQELRAYIDQRERESAIQSLSPEERIKRLDIAARAIREGFTEEEWAEIEQAMNEEYIEPVDEDVWKD